jgi:antitoxin HigA-1
MKFGNVVSGRRLAAVNPGEVLLKDFIEPLGLTRYRVAKAIGVAQRARG